jgi:hypothetical protein
MKYIFKVKAPRMKECPFQQDTTEPWEYSVERFEDLHAWITECKNNFQHNTW